MDYANGLSIAYERFEKSMKILHVITSLQTGGAEKLVTDIVPMLKMKGADVDVCLFDGQETAFKKRLENTGCKIYSFSNGGNVYNPLNILRLTRLMRHYDIVHTHNTAPQLFGAIGSVLCSVVMRHYCELITTEHNTSNRRRHWKWYVYIDRWMYHRYKRIICISNQAEENLRLHLKRDNLQIKTIFNGVSVESFHNAQPIASMKASERFVVIMVAGFRYQKDQDTLIRAVSMLSEKDYELWLVGDGERRKELEGLVEGLGLQDRVRFLGLRTDVAELLHTADVVVMSSHWEGLSLSNIEGMSVGKPFVASDVDGLHEVTDGYGILFPHGDADKLAEIITRLHDDKAYYDKIAAACYERAKQFDINKTVDGYFDVYSELV